MLNLQASGLRSWHDHRSSRISRKIDPISHKINYHSYASSPLPSKFLEFWRLIAATCRRGQPALRCNSRTTVGSNARTSSEEYKEQSSLFDLLSECRSATSTYTKYIWRYTEPGGQRSLKLLRAYTTRSDRSYDTAVDVTSADSPTAKLQAGLKTSADLLTSQLSEDDATSARLCCSQFASVWCSSYAEKARRPVGCLRREVFFGGLNGLGELKIKEVVWDMSDNLGSSKGGRRSAKEWSR